MSSRAEGEGLCLEATEHCKGFTLFFVYSQAICFDSVL